MASPSRISWSPIRVGEHVNARVRDAVLVVVGALFIYLTALVVVPHEPVPWTGQTFGVLFVGCALGFRRGLASVALYVLLGVIGLPFFAQGQGGLSVILSGDRRLSRRVHRRRRARRTPRGAWLGPSHRRGDRGDGHRQLIIYAIGVPWLKAVTGMTWSDAVANGLTPFVAWDLAKLALAAAFFPTAWWLVGRRPDDR